MTYRLRLLFEWGGGALWAENDAAREAFGDGAIEDVLIEAGHLRSPEVLEGLETLSKRHDTALNWEYPPDPGPWTRAEYAAFEAAAEALLVRLRAELGPAFALRYEPLGAFVDPADKPQRA